jgi:hypothetical protein
VIPEYDGAACITPTYKGNFGPQDGFWLSECANALV